MFKSLDSVASVVGIIMYLTISKFKQVLRSRKGLDYNTVSRSKVCGSPMLVSLRFWEGPAVRNLTVRSVYSDCLQENAGQLLQLLRDCFMVLPQTLFQLDHRWLTLLWLQGVKISQNVHILARVYQMHLKVKHCQTLRVVKYIYRLKWVDRFWLVKAFSSIVQGGQKDSKKTSQKCPCVHIWVNNQNSQLTDFDHCSYLPLKCSYSRSVSRAAIEYFHLAYFAVDASKSGVRADYLQWSLHQHLSGSLTSDRHKTVWKSTMDIRLILNTTDLCINRRPRLPLSAKIAICHITVLSLFQVQLTALKERFDQKKQPFKKLFIYLLFFSWQHLFRFCWYQTHYMET